MQFATRIIRLENENRILKAIAQDRQAFRSCESEEDYLKILSERFAITFTAVRRYLCSPQGTIVFSMPGSMYRSSYEIPRNEHDRAMTLALQGKINIVGSYLFYPEKNIPGITTQIYANESPDLLKMSEAQKKNLIAQMQLRKHSPEEIFVPMYVSRWSDETIPSVEAFEEELHSFFLKLENFFYVGEIQLSFVIDAGIEDFKFFNPEWTVHSEIVNGIARKKENLQDIPQKQMTVIKKNPLYHDMTLLPESRDNFHFLLTRQGKGGRYWGTLILRSVFPFNKDQFVMPELKKILHEMINRFSRRASGNLMVIDLHDHLGKVKSKSKVSDRQANTHELSHLPNARAFENHLKYFFKTYQHLSANEKMAVTYLDGKFLKIKNESLGHETTNEIIKQISRVVSKASLPYHLHGDEFAIFSLVNSVEEHRNEISGFLAEIKENPFYWETSYYELAVSLRLAIINAGSLLDPGQRKEKSQPQINARSIWRRMGLRLPYHDHDPLLREIVFYLTRIQKKMNQTKFEIESFKKILNENLKALSHISDRDEKKKFIHQADQELIHLEEQNDRDYSLYWNKLNEFPRNQYKIFQDRADQKIKIPVTLEMTAGTIFIGTETYGRYRHQVFDHPDMVGFLKLMTLGAADKLRTTGRLVGRDFSFQELP